MLSVLPVLALMSSAVLLALAIYQLINPGFSFWPPPEDQPRKKTAFITLFRIVIYGLIFYSMLRIWYTGLPLFAPRTVLAVLFIICGFAIAFGATLALGWGNAFGAKEGLRTEGIFRYSRNPIYIATWIGLAGWALLIPEPIVVASLLNWALLYLAAIFLEERWLAQEYEEKFHDYRASVRRFF
ncbi:methyltransferase family protein [Pararhodobacter oceanensis]|nr:methyltransferase [Pararhodobacter oceanensis]